MQLQLTQYTLVTRFHRKINLKQQTTACAFSYHKIVISLAVTVLDDLSSSCKLQNRCDKTRKHNPAQEYNKIFLRRGGKKDLFTEG